MKRSWIAAAALLATACGGHEVVQCGACQGPHYSTTGLPAGLHVDSVRVCIADRPCTTTRRPHRFTEFSQPLAIQGDASSLDGKPLTVVVRSGHRRWSGSGALHVIAAGNGPCDCGGVEAAVALSRADPSG